MAEGTGVSLELSTILTVGGDLPESLRAISENFAQLEQQSNSLIATIARVGTEAETLSQAFGSSLTGVQALRAEIMTLEGTSQAVGSAITTELDAAFNAVRTGGVAALSTAINELQVPMRTLAAESAGIASQIAEQWETAARRVGAAQSGMGGGAGNVPPGYTGQNPRRRDSLPYSPGERYEADEENARINRDARQRANDENEAYQIRDRAEREQERRLEREQADIDRAFQQAQKEERHRQQQFDRDYAHAEMEEQRRQRQYEHDYAAADREDLQRFPTSPRAIDDAVNRMQEGQTRQRLIQEELARRTAPRSFVDRYRSMQTGDAHVSALANLSMEKLIAAGVGTHVLKDTLNMDQNLTIAMTDVGVTDPRSQQAGELRERFRQMSRQAAVGTNQTGEQTSEFLAKFVSVLNLSGSDQEQMNRLQQLFPQALRTAENLKNLHITSSVSGEAAALGELMGMVSHNRPEHFNEANDAINAALLMPRVSAQHFLTQFRHSEDTMRLANMPDVSQLFWVSQGLQRGLGGQTGFDINAYLKPLIMPQNVTSVPADLNLHHLESLARAHQTTAADVRELNLLRGASTMGISPQEAQRRLGLRDQSGGIDPALQHGDMMLNVSNRLMTLVENIRTPGAPGFQPEGAGRESAENTLRQSIIRAFGLSGSREVSWIFDPRAREDLEARMMNFAQKQAAGSNEINAMLNAGPQQHLEQVFARLADVGQRIVEGGLGALDKVALGLVHSFEGLGDFLDRHPFLNSLLGTAGVGLAGLEAVRLLGSVAGLTMPGRVIRAGTGMLRSAVEDSVGIAAGTALGGGARRLYSTVEGSITRTGVGAAEGALEGAGARAATGAVVSAEERAAAGAIAAVERASGKGFVVGTITSMAVTNATIAGIAAAAGAAVGAAVGIHQRGQETAEAYALGYKPDLSSRFDEMGMPTMLISPTGQRVAPSDEKLQEAIRIAREDRDVPEEAERRLRQEQETEQTRLTEAHRQVRIREEMDKRRQRIDDEMSRRRANQPHREFSQMEIDAHKRDVQQYIEDFHQMPSDRAYQSFGLPIPSAEERSAFGRGQTVTGQPLPQGGALSTPPGPSAAPSAPPPVFGPGARPAAPTSTPDRRSELGDPFARFADLSYQQKRFIGPDSPQLAMAATGTATDSPTGYLRYGEAGATPQSERRRGPTAPPRPEVSAPPLDLQPAEQPDSMVPPVPPTPLPGPIPGMSFPLPPSERRIPQQGGLAPYTHTEQVLSGEALTNYLAEARRRPGWFEAARPLPGGPMGGFEQPMIAGRVDTQRFAQPAPRPGSVTGNPEALTAADPMYQQPTASPDKPRFEPPRGVYPGPHRYAGGNPLALPGGVYSGQGIHWQTAQGVGSTSLPQVPVGARVNTRAGEVHHFDSSSPAPADGSMSAGAFLGQRYQNAVSPAPQQTRRSQMSPGMSSPSGPHGSTSMMSPFSAPHGTAQNLPEAGPYRPGRGGAPSSGVLSAIADATRAVPGTDFGYMMAMARQESGFRPDAHAPNTSAAGLYQFIDSTWRGVVNSPEGRRLGLTMEGRNDPRQAAIGAALYTQENKRRIEQVTHHTATPAELYMGHFMGGGGAAQFYGALQQNPSAAAASLFPTQAAANRNIFYDQQGNPRSLAQVQQLMHNKIDVPSAGLSQQYSAQAGLTNGPAVPAAMPAHAAAANLPIPSSERNRVRMGGGSSGEFLARQYGGEDHRLPADATSSQKVPQPNDIGGPNSEAFGRFGYLYPENSGDSTHIHNINTHLDGELVARNTVETIIRNTSGANRGLSGFDPSMNPAQPGPAIMRT